MYGKSPQVDREQRYSGSLHIKGNEQVSTTTRRTREDTPRGISQSERDSSPIDAKTERNSREIYTNNKRSEIGSGSGRTLQQISPRDGRSAFKQLIPYKNSSKLEQSKQSFKDFLKENSDFYKEKGLLKEEQEQTNILNTYVSYKTGKTKVSDITDAERQQALVEINKIKKLLTF